jgi:hypothetical protein
MTFEESAALMNDPQFRGRIKVACLKYADYVVTSNLPGTGMSLRRWADQTFTAPDVSAQQVQAAVVMDAAVQSTGPSIADPALQSAVETVVKKMV